MRKGTPELRPFSLWMPTVLVLLIVGAPIVLYYWANSGEAQAYTDPSRKIAECDAAAAIAQEMSLQITAKNPNLASRISFSPLLYGTPPPADYGEYQSVLQTLKSVLVMPMRFDCSEEFKRYPLKIAALGVPGRNDFVKEKYRFSRITLSENDTAARVAVGMVCANLCGGGNFAIWQKKHGRWILIRTRPTWVA